MGHCLFMRKGETHTAPVSYKANFADNTWEQIIDACQKNAVPETWLVGDQKTMTINGTDYAIDIIGKNHDTYSDGSGTAPLTFQMHDCYGDVYPTWFQMNSEQTNTCGWTSVDIRTTLLPSILVLMPNEVQSAIKEVNKFTSVGGQSSNINTTADKLFLLSEIELFGTTTASFSGEGTQYSFYASGNSSWKYVQGNAVSWWLRSPYKTYSKHFCYAVFSKVDYQIADGTSGLSFAFCF